MTPDNTNRSSRLDVGSAKMDFPTNVDGRVRSDGIVRHIDSTVPLCTRHHYELQGAPCQPYEARCVVCHHKLDEGNGAVMGSRTRVVAAIKRYEEAS